ncbi:hypothetical protein A2U01_0019046, partial [Trifolium medium]|nr:hypothetical protein [Trifolium medium]
WLTVVDGGQPPEHRRQPPCRSPESPPWVVGKSPSSAAPVASGPALTAALTNTLHHPY